MTAQVKFVVCMLACLTIPFFGILPLIVIMLILAGVPNK